MRATPKFGYLEGTCVDQGLTEVTHRKPRWTDVQQASRGWPQKGGQVGATSSLQLLSYADWSFPWSSSVVRQIPGYNSKGARPAFPKHGGLQLKWLPPQVAESISQSDPHTSRLNPPESHPTKILFTKDTLPDGTISHQKLQPLIWKSQGLPLWQKPR
jgi:hypothetical protein